jgi:hypothetical protein
MSQITLSDGTNDVTIQECTEERPTMRIAYDARIDVDGQPRLYTIPEPLTYLHFAGRLLAKEEAQQIESWSADETELTYTGRDGVSDGGWRIHADPPAKISRKDGDSLDWLIDARLWRLS